MQLDLYVPTVHHFGVQIIQSDTRDVSDKASRDFAAGTKEGRADQSQKECDFAFC